MIKKKTKIIFFTSFIVGLIGIIGIIIDAINMPSGAIALGWIFLSMIILGCVGFITTLVLLIIDNKEALRKFFRKYKEWFMF